MTGRNAIMYPTRLRRAGGFALEMGVGFLRQPTRLPSELRMAAGAILDEQFQASSPIPMADDKLLAGILSQEVLLPPMALKIPGNQSTKGLIFLLSLARAVKATCAFEIGTYNGLTARALAQNLPDATIHTLDIPPEAPTALGLERTDHFNRIAFGRMAYEDTPMADRVTQHWGDSATFDFSPWGATCDLVYVDGSHSAAYVASDTENALRMLSPNGAIVWDDYWWRIAGVREVLDELSGLELWRMPGTRLVVHLTPGARSCIHECDPWK